MPNTLYYLIKEKETNKSTVRRDVWLDQYRPLVTAHYHHRVYCNAHSSKPRADHSLPNGKVRIPSLINYAELTMRPTTL